MNRLCDWPEVLDGLLSETRAWPFQYGRWDCFQFMRRAVQAMTGCDLAATFRPYASPFGYRRQMLRYCQSMSLVTFAETLMDAAGCPEVPVEMARRGDVVLVNEKDPAFGVLSLNGRSALSLASSGKIEHLPLSSLIAAWRI